MYKHDMYYKHTYTHIKYMCSLGKKSVCNRI